MPDENEVRFHSADWDYFREQRDFFNGLWKESVKNLGSDLIEHIKLYLEENVSIFKSTTNITLELVVDSNVIYRDVYGIVKGKSSFLNDLIDNSHSFLKFYAPPDIITEVNRAIDEDLPKRFDKVKAKEIAKNTISKINILEGQKWEAVKRADALIGGRDKKDVPFMALSLSMRTHGIVTYDKDFSIGKIRKWKLSETERMVTDISEGAFSFFIIGNGLPVILQIGYWLCISILNLIAYAIGGLVELAIALAAGSIDALSRIPPEILLMVGGIVTLAYIFSEQVRQGVNDFISMLADIAKKIIEGIKEVFSAIVEYLKSVFEVLMPFVSFSVKGVGYLLYSSAELISKMDTLEGYRAS